MPLTRHSQRPSGPAQMPNDQTDCDTWQRLHLERIACFGSIRTVHGATKPVVHGGETRFAAARLACVAGWRGACGGASAGA